MDRAVNSLNPFTRGSSSPQSQNATVPLPQQSQQGPSKSPQSYREPSPPIPPKTIDSLFRNLNIPSNASQSPQQSFGNQQFDSASVHSNNSAPTTPVSSLTAASVSSGPVGSSAIQSAERQSALLSLLGSVSAASNTTSLDNGAAVSHIPPPPMTQQSSTPPPAESRPVGSEAQGKLLLEQLMSGSAKSNYSEAPSVYPMMNPYPPRHPGSVGSESDSFQNREPTYVQQAAPRDLPRPPQTSFPQQQPPSPSRKSIFDFVSPYDAFSTSTSVPAPKKTEVTTSTGSRDTDDSWTSVSASADPKRKSVDNLMDQLTRSQNIHGIPQQQPEYYSSEYGTPQDSPAMQSRAPPTGSLPPKLPPSPPRASPPRMLPQDKPRTGESPQLTGVQMSGSSSGFLAGREKADSPPLRGGWKTGQESKVRGPQPKGRSFLTMGATQQNIVFDVSQTLESVQASRDYVKSTAIALVRVDSTFLPGTTIGATHWVAYAMTKGRVRVISRSSGDRTLLQLPGTFPSTASVTDMAVHGNRLAGVTSDGGFIVWELPEVITDDVPGRILLHVIPTSNMDPLHSVKWHPRDSDTLAVASDSNLYLIDIHEASESYGGEPIIQSDLPRVGQVFRISSPLIAFDFDIMHYAIATISEDSTLTMWSMRDRTPFWSQKVPGPGLPSSITFLDAAIAVGRQNGTFFQLLPVMSGAVLGTLSFVNSAKEDLEMFGHVTYDSRIQTLWIANSRRESLIAVKIGYELGTPSPNGEEPIRGAFFEQVVEFIGPKSTIHFVILTADADPNGDEATAACVAAKLPPGELALVAFSVHSTGVDQVLIRKEWFDSAFASTTAKFPPFNSQAIPLPIMSVDLRSRRQLNVPPTQPPPQASVHSQPLSQPIPSAPLRLRTPPSEEAEIDHGKEETRASENKGKINKGKNVGWKDKDESAKENNKSSKTSGSETIAANDSTIGNAISKELKKVEESLHTRIGRLIAKELDKQQQRMEEARVNEQQADFLRQEKILKLISTELTKNTTRVVETAVKGEVQNSVLPSLESITKAEVKSAMSSQIARGFGDSMKQSLPPEIEKVLAKPEVANQLARTLSTSLTPLIERHVKDAITKTLIPAYQAQSASMHQELSREIRNEIAEMKKEIASWQGEALRAQESAIRDMEQSIRALSEQIKLLAIVPPVPHSNLPTRSSPGATSGGQFGPSNMMQMGAMHHRQPPLPIPGITGQHQSFSSFQQPTPPASQWYGSPVTSHHSSHSQMQAISQSPSQPNASGRSEDWDDTYLAVLGTQDLKQLRELLARSSPDVVMPSSGSGPLSQAVMLTLVHRLAAAIGETSPVDEAFKQSIWWLQRAAATLNTNDPLISPYTGRVIPNVQSMLNTTKQRLALLPGGPQLLDTTRMISEIQDTLSRKPM